jgi:hypothetical protein
MFELRRRIHLLHKHRAVSMHLLVQRDGVPYRVERIVCSDCARVLAEQPLQRAVA